MQTKVKEVKRGRNQPISDLSANSLTTSGSSRNARLHSSRIAEVSTGKWRRKGLEISKTIISGVKLTTKSHLFHSRGSLDTVMPQLIRKPRQALLIKELRHWGLGGTHVDSHAIRISAS